MDKKKFFILLSVLFLTVNVFADQKKKVNTYRELDEKTRLEFDYSFAEGVKYKITNDLQTALGWFDNCLKVFPESAPAKFEIANILFLKEDYNGALQLIREAIAGDPDNVWYKVLMAGILQKKGMIEEACSVYAEIITKEPEKEEYYLLEAGLYVSVEKWEKAIEVYNRYEKKFGITEAVSIEKIKLYSKMDNLKLASNELSALIKKYPERNEYLGLLAELYFNHNQDKKGLQILNKILGDDPQNGYVNLFLADYYGEKNKQELADKHVKIAFLNDELDNTFKIQYMLKLALDPDTTKNTDVQLQSYMNLLMQKYSDDLSVRALHSDFLKKDDKLQEARGELEYIVSKDPNNYLIWEELLLLCNQMVDTACMYDKSLEAIKYFPEQPLPYALAGISQILKKNYADAIGYFEKGVTLSGDKPVLKAQFYSYLGDCYYNLDSIDLAFQMFDNVLDINPNDVLVLNNYSYYLSLKNRRLDDAERMASKAVSLESDNGTYLDTYAWVLYMRKDYSQAKYYIKRAIEKTEKPSGVLYEHYGDILFMSGEKEEALKMWKKALEIGDDYSSVLKQKIEKGILIEDEN